MIASNSHGHPPLDPDRPCDLLLDLPDGFFDLMFGDSPDEKVNDPEDEPERLVA
jgi:hypothetical protein